MLTLMLGDVVDLDRHCLDDPDFVATCRDELAETGVLVLRGFLHGRAVDELVAEAESQQHLAFHSEQTHNVYLDPPDTTAPRSSARSRAIRSTKGAVTTDLVADDSGLRTLYDSPTFRSFVAAVVQEEALYEYADPLSSINVNFFGPGEELGWHFDNSSFSVTLLLQAPEAGGRFEFIDAMRDADTSFQNEEEVATVLDQTSDRSPVYLDQRPGDLVLFRGRNALHHVTPVEGDRTRLLVVLAYNTEPGLSLPENARLTFFGRLS